MPKGYGAVYEYLEKVYGGLVKTIEQLVVVNTTRTDLVRNSPDRVELVFVNVGPEAAFLFTTNQDFASGVGVRIASNGGMLSVNLIHDSVLPSLQWFGKASPAATSVFIMEVVREAI